MPNKGGIITRKDIISDDAMNFGKDYAEQLKIAINSNITLVNSVKELNNLAKKFKSAENQKEYVAAKQAEVLATQEAINAIKKQEAAEISALKIKKQSIITAEAERKAKIAATNAEIKGQAAKEKSIKLTAKERYEIQQLNKMAKQAAILSSTLSTEYEKQSVKLTQLRRSYKDAALTQGYTSKEAKRLRTEINKLDATLKQVDGHVGQYQRSVGQYGNAMKSASAAARSMMSAMGVVGGAYLFVNVIRDAFARVREFDKSMQNLSGVFRTTRKELAPLEADIISIAGSSIKTSNEVAKLAESLATLGKSPEQIQKLLKPVVDLGIGLEATGEEAGEFLVQMLNAFGASDDEALQYADTIASIRTSTSLDFQKMRDSFQYIAPISKALNKDLAYTGALVGILADNGFKAEKSGRLVASSQLRLAKSGLSLNDGLEILNKSIAEGKTEVDLLAIATELFGVNSAAIGITLANNSDIIDKNAQAIRDNGGALKDLTDEQLKSLDAKLKILDSIWEELILTIENGEGSIAGAFTGFVETITFAIQKTIELEKAQSKLFEIGVEENGWRSFFNTIIPPLGIINSDYEKAIELQKEFNKKNENLNELDLRNLQFRLEEVNSEYVKLGEVESKQSKAYAQQIRNIVEVIGVKKIEREELEKQAVALGYNTSLEGEYVKAKKQSDYILKQFVDSNKANIDVIIKETEAEKTLRLEKEKTNKAYASRLKLLKADEFSFKKAQLESEIQTNKAILEDEKATLSEKQLASLRYYDAKEALLDLQKNKEIEASQGRSDKLAEIQLKYNDDTINNEQDREAKALVLLKSHFDQEVKLIKEAEQAKKDAQNQEIGQAQSNLQSSAQSPADIEAYEQKVAEIKKRYALETVQAQIDAVKKLQENKTFSVEEQAELSKQLSLLEISYSNISTDQILENNEAQILAEEEKAQRLAEIRQRAFATLTDGLADALNIDSSGLNDLFDSLEDVFNKTATGVTGTLQVMSAAANVATDIISSVHQANIEELEGQLDASNAYYDNEIERAEGDKVQQDLLREEKQLKENELNKKIAKEKTKAAKAEKAAAIIKAGINTALAVTAALATVPFSPLGLIMAGLAGALGLAQIGLIASKPIPKYKHGRKGGPAEFAEVGDGFVKEVIERNDGTAYLTPARPTLAYLEEGDKVHSSVEDYYALQKAAMMSSINMQGRKMNNYQANHEFNKNLKQINQKDIEDAISKGFKNQKVHFHTTTNAKVDMNYPIWRLKQLYRE